MTARIITILISIPTCYFVVFGNNPWINAGLLAAWGFSVMCWDESFLTDQSRGNGTDRYK